MYVTMVCLFDLTCPTLFIDIFFVVLRLSCYTTIDRRQKRETDLRFQCKLFWHESLTRSYGSRVLAHHICANNLVTA